MSNQKNLDTANSEEALYRMEEIVVNYLARK